MRILLFCLVFLFSASAYGTEDVYLLLKNNDVQRAFDRLKQHDLSTITEVLLFADLARQNGEYDEAITVLATHAVRYPNEAKIPFELGVTYIFKDQIKNAYTMFKRSIEIDPDHLAARVNLIRVAIWRERFSEARSEINALKKRNPEHVELKLLDAQLGRRLLRRGQVASTYASVLAIDRSNADATLGAQTLDQLWRLQVALGTSFRYSQGWRGGPSFGVKYRFSDRTSCFANSAVLNQPWTVSEFAAGCTAVFQGKHFFTLQGTTFNFTDEANVEASWAERWTDRFTTQLGARFGVVSGDVALKTNASFRIGFLTPSVGYQFSIPTFNHRLLAGLESQFGPLSVSLAGYREGQLTGLSSRVGVKLNEDISFGVGVATEFTDQTRVQTSAQISYAF